MASAYLGWSRLVSVQLYLDIFCATIALGILDLDTSVVYKVGFQSK